MKEILKELWEGTPLHIKASLYMLFVLLFVTCFLMKWCTYSLTMLHTKGEATDVVDETVTNTPTISPTLSIPAKVI
jgi:hypothetical protein